MWDSPLTLGILVKAIIYWVAGVATFCLGLYLLGILLFSIGSFIDRVLGRKRKHTKF